jgi:ribonucleoside-diphosphate reductase alpha chain
MSQSDDSWRTHSLDNFENIKDGHSYVIKRDGKKQPVFFDKITIRLNNLCKNIKPVISSKDVDTVAVAQKVINGLYPGIRTSELDNLAAETAAYMISQHPAYGDLAARIAISNLQKEAPQTFMEAMELEYRNVQNGTNAPLLSDEAYEFMKKHQKKIQEAIVPERDFGYDYFGFKTLEKSYLVSINGKTVETPQYLIMRVSIGIHLDDIDAALETYDLMSQRIFTHATPTLFNAATRFPQMSSCKIKLSLFVVL